MGRLSVILFLTSLPALAESWYGYLVDAKCYAAEERNVNPNDTIPGSRDLEQEVRYCSPGAKSKVLAVIAPDWTVLALDAEGNGKAVALVKQIGKKRAVRVEVTGQRRKDTLTVDTISEAPSGTQSRTSSHRGNAPE